MLLHPGERWLPPTTGDHKGPPICIKLKKDELKSKTMGFR